MSGPPRASRLEGLARAKWRLVGLVLALCFYALLWLVVVAGGTALVAPLIVVPVIALLVAGGNWLQHWLGITHSPPQYAEPSSDVEEPER